MFPVAFLQLSDIDSIRRRYGFDGAEHICQSIERSLRRELDPSSALCRLNAWTFVSILDGSDLLDPDQSLERIRHVVEHTDTLWWGDAVEVNLATSYTWITLTDSLDSVIPKMQSRAKCR
jgi:GGDEF domain-containing protein